MAMGTTVKSEHDPAASTADSDNETSNTEVVEKKKKMDQSSPDSLASELNRDTQGGDVDGEDAGIMGDVEQVGGVWNDIRASGLADCVSSLKNYFDFNQHDVSSLKSY